MYECHWYVAVEGCWTETLWTVVDQWKLWADGMVIMLLHFHDLNDSTSSAPPILLLIQLILWLTILQPLLLLPFTSLLFSLLLLLLPVTLLLIQLTNYYYYYYYPFMRTGRLKMFLFMSTIHIVRQWTGNKVENTRSTMSTKRKTSLRRKRNKKKEKKRK